MIEYKYNYFKYLESDKWKKIREQVLQRDNNKCTICGASDNLIIHHVSYDNLGNEKIEDLTTVCEKCHTKIHSTKNWNKSKNKVNKKEIDKMIEDKNIDTNKLYQYCRIANIINTRGQIQTFGIKLNDEIEDLLIEQGIVCSYVLKVIKLAHPFTHILKKTKKTQITTWTELWKQIDCTNSAIQKKVKDFLEQNKLIKAVPIKNEQGKSKKLFVLNPYLYKNSSHAGQFACIVWQESAKPNININFYAYMWLVSQDVIVIDNDKDYDKIISDFINNKNIRAN